MNDTTVLRSKLDTTTEEAAWKVLAGGRRSPKSLLPFVGPAVVASVAYIDPGNVATNVQGGAAYGYQLLWVVLLANLVAMLFQGLSARLGIVTGRNLAELCHDHLPRPLVVAMWLISEVAAMATDLAEFIGASIALTMLLHVPLLASMAATGVATYAILTMQAHGFRPLERVIGGLVALIGASYLVELLIAPLDWSAAVYHSVVPELSGGGAVTLAVGIVGATVMPHAIFLHSSLTQDRIRPRDEDERRRLIGLSNWEVVGALAMAGVINLAMLAMAAAVFHDGVHESVAELADAYRTLVPLLGRGAAVLFAIALLASGLSSSVVGTMAGQVIMQGFVGFRIPLLVRRLVTMVPAFVVIGWGVDPTHALVLSQVVLSLVLPVPVLALVVFSSRDAVMGSYRLGWRMMALAIIATTLVCLLNLLLLLQLAKVPLPFLAGS
jgi:manganese transport protein